MAKSINKFIVFQISGGIGKNILSTAVVKALNEKHPDRKIVVLTAYKEVWLNNPHVYRIHTFQTAQYFYDTYIRFQKDTMIFAHDPYMSEDYLKNNKHLIEIWGDLCGVDCSGFEPELFFNKREIEYAQNNFGKSPYMVIQTNGGMNPNIKQSWYRDIPIDFAQRVVDDFAQRIEVVHLRREDQLALNNTRTFQGSMRESWLLLLYSKKSLLMDSMGQHAMAAMQKPSTVLWIGNDPKVLGYNLHDNIKARKFDINSNPNALLEPYNIAGIIEECPYMANTDELFDLDNVIASIKAQ